MPLLKLHDLIYYAWNLIKTIKGLRNEKVLLDNYAEHTPQTPVGFRLWLRFCYPIVKS